MRVSSSNLHFDLDLKTLFPLLVENSEEQKRLDQFLAQRFRDFSRSRWSRLIDTGQILVNGELGQSSKKLKIGDTIEVLPDAKLSDEATIDYSAKFIGLEPSILYEDESLVVVNKPKGLLVHVGAGHDFNETLVAWLVGSGRIKKKDLFKFGEIPLEEARPGIVHRLDLDTSGAMVVAKTPSAQESLSKQFAQRVAGRKYWALLQGRLEGLKDLKTSKLDKLLSSAPRAAALREQNGCFSFVSNLSRDPVRRKRFAVSAMAGKRAITHFEVLVAKKEITWIQLRLETGRTHQIRVHLSYLGFPILGDKIYGGSELEFLALHAREIMFFHPETKKKIAFQADLYPEEKEFYRQHQLELKDFL